jgi:hypothetical protein
MRARNIKPGFFIDSKIGKLSGNEKILYIGLWCIADKEGFFKNEPEEIKVQIFPYETKIDIKKMLSNLIQLNLIKSNADIKEYCYIPNFIKHQRPHPDEAKSKVSDDIIKVFKNNHIKSNGISLNPSESTSDIMNDDIMNDERGKRNTDAGKEAGYLSLFDRLWKLYPIKKEKQKSILEFKKARLQNGEFDEIINALNSQIAHKDDCDKNGKFCPEFPYLHRWIKSKRWTDEIEKTKICILDEEKHKKARAEYVEKRKREMEEEGNNNHV